MGKHSKNNNDRAFFTYHERQAAAKGYASSAFYKHVDGGYGGGVINVGTDSLREFDACCLSLHPCTEPVITPEGYLYEKEVILEYILQKRKEIEEATRAWDAEQARAAAAAALASQAAEAAAIEKFAKGLEGFEAAAHEGSSAGGARGAKSAVRGHVINDDMSRHAKDMNFWTPQNAPTAVKGVDKPEGVVRCPMSGEKLRVKQLTAVRFTPAPRTEHGTTSRKVEAQAVQERYICPLSKKPLTKNATCVVLRPSGTVIAKDSYNAIVKKDMLDPFCDPPAKLKERDVITIKTEGTGFAGRGNTEVKKKRLMVRGGVVGATSVLQSPLTHACAHVRVAADVLKLSGAGCHSRPGTWWSRVDGHLGCNSLSPALRSKGD